MDNYGIFIGILCLLVFMGPILFLAFKERKKARSIQNRIATIAQQNNMQNSEMHELGNLIFLINKNDQTGIVFPRNTDDHIVTVFDKKRLDQVTVSYENEKLANGKSIITKIIIHVKSGSKHIQMSAFDESYPNQMEATSLVEKTKNLIFSIHKL